MIRYKILICKSLYIIMVEGALPIKNIYLDIFPPSYMKLKLKKYLYLKRLIS